MSSATSRSLATTGPRKSPETQTHSPWDLPVRRDSHTQGSSRPNPPCLPVFQGKPRDLRERLRMGWGRTPKSLPQVRPHSRKELPLHRSQRQVHPRNERKAEEGPTNLLDTAPDAVPAPGDEKGRDVDPWSPTRGLRLLQGLTVRTRGQDRSAPHNPVADSTLVVVTDGPNSTRGPLTPMVLPDPSRPPTRRGPRNKASSWTRRGTPAPKESVGRVLDTEDKGRV